MRNPTPGARLADVLLDGRLTELIQAARAEGRSWEWIARDIYMRTGQQVNVTGVTVASWAERGSDEGAA